MDELELLREYGASTPLPTEADLAPTRAKLVTAMRGRRSFRLPSWGWGGVAVAAAAAVTIVAWPAVAPVSQVPPAQADPVQILHRAAAAALKLPDGAPRPDQFIYTKLGQGGDGKVRESWMSADDTHDGLIINTDGTKEVQPGCVAGKRRVLYGNRVKPGQTEPCEPRPAYLKDLPTTVDGMAKYLLENKSGVKGDMHAMFKDVYSMVSQYMSPQARAALYEAAGKIPGVKAVPNATDAAGRPGVGIGGPQDADPVIVFDATTYAYLGDTSYEAVLAFEIVDKVEQRP